MAYRIWIFKRNGDCSSPRPPRNLRCCAPPGCLFLSLHCILWTQLLGNCSLHQQKGYNHNQTPEETLIADGCSETTWVAHSASGGWAVGCWALKASCGWCCRTFGSSKTSTLPPTTAFFMSSTSVACLSRSWCTCQCKEFYETLIVHNAEVLPPVC